MPGTEPGHFHFVVSSKFNETVMTGIANLKYDKKSLLVIVTASGSFQRDEVLDMHRKLFTFMGENPCNGVLLDIRDVTHEYPAGDAFAVFDRTAALVSHDFKYAIVTNEMNLDRYEAGAEYIGHCLDVRVFLSRDEAETWLGVQG